MRNIIRSNNWINNQKKKYLFLSIILLSGIISGIIFIFFISAADKNLIIEHYDSIFNSIQNNSINLINTLINSTLSNIFTCIILYILAISIIGIPVSIFYLFIKGFSFGLSISSIISIYKLRGILLTISFLFPHQIVLLIINILLVFYSINFSMKLLRYLFFKENIPITKYLFKLNKVFLTAFSIMILCSLFETYLTPLIIDLCL